jgi:hypothetical protein
MRVTANLRDAKAEKALAEINTPQRLGTNNHVGRLDVRKRRRRIESINWACKVVAGLRGANAVLGTV